MPDYRTVDWEQPRPDSEQIEEGWSRSWVSTGKEPDGRIQAVVQSLRATHVNGGAAIAQFCLEVAPEIAWFLTRNRPEEAAFFSKFFNLDHVQERLGTTVPDAAEGDDLGFGLESTFVAIGRLAQIVSQGGAYRNFDGSDTNLLKLIRNFTAAAFEDRYSETCAYLSWKPWCSWFKDVAWDASFFWFDKRTGTAIVLVVTDTD